MQFFFERFVDSTVGRNGIEQKGEGVCGGSRTCKSVNDHFSQQKSKPSGILLSKLSWG